MIDRHLVFDVRDPADIHIALKDIRGRAIARYDGSVSIEVPDTSESPWHIERPLYGHIHPLVTIRGVVPNRMPKWDEIQISDVDISSAQGLPAAEKNKKIKEIGRAVASADASVNQELYKTLMPTQFIFERQAVLLYAGEHLRLESMLVMQEASSDGDKYSALQIGDVPYCMGVGASLVLQSFIASKFSRGGLAAIYGGGAWADGKRGDLPDGLDLIIDGMGDDGIRSQYSSDMLFTKGEAVVNSGGYGVFMKGDGWNYSTDGYMGGNVLKDFRLLGTSNAHFVNGKVKGDFTAYVENHGYFNADGVDADNVDVRYYNGSKPPHENA